MSTTTSGRNPNTPPEPEGPPAMSSATPTPPARVKSGLMDPKMLLTSIPDAVRKLDPRVMVHSPVMFVVEVGAAGCTVLAISASTTFAWWVTIWLGLTVIFPNLAEAVAEGRGKAQAASLRRAKTETIANLLRKDGTVENVPATGLTLGDRVVVVAGEIIPGDGDAGE